MTAKNECEDVIMNINKVSFYNLGAMEPIPGHGEYGMMRIPVRVRNHLNERARFVGQESVGIEIRFVTDAPIIDLYISAMKPEFEPRGSVRVYKGNYQVCNFEIEPGTLKFYRINDLQCFKNVNDNMFNQGGFSANVWRVVCGRGVHILQGIDVHGHDIRAPKKEELPKHNWLAYGSSITNSHLDGYVHIAASRLRMEVQNKGFSGSCHLEKELVDYMLDECESDFMTFELGVNMRENFSIDEFSKRVEYLIDRLLELNKAAVMISTFPNEKSLKFVKEADICTKREAEYEKILEEHVKRANNRKLGLIKGNEILTDIYGLSGDLVHPTVFGHGLMGLNLAEKLSLFISENGLLESIRN